MSDTAAPPILLLFRPRKALAAINLMLRLAREDGRGEAGLHTLLKACYFADKAHLNAHRRPVFGATYRAMAYGPVPLEVYEMLKGEIYWLPEIGRDDYPWHQSGRHIVPTTGAVVDPSSLSRSEEAALRDGFARARYLIFNERTAESHDIAWQRARNGLMSYADMVEPDNPDREAILDALYEDAHRWMA
jgi:hypothetical protein